MIATARDIALIFLSLEAFFFALVPLALFSALAYGVYKLRAIVKQYMQLAFAYVEKARQMVERASHAVAEPFIKAHCTYEMVRTILVKFNPRRLLP